MNEEHHYGNDENEVDEPAGDVEAEAKEPEDDENNDDRVEHRSVRWFPYIRT